MPRGRRKGEGTGPRPVAWAGPFLDALGRTGNVRVSAEAAGIDVTGAYNRRQRCAAFREDWLRILAEREARAAGDLRDAASVGSGDSEDGRVSSPLALPPGDAGRVPPSPAGGEGMVARTSATGAKMVRVATARWGRNAEESFLGELAASANVRQAARAAGFSAETIYRRRLKSRPFAQAWDAAIEVGKARLKAMLVEAAQRSFDPGALPIGEEPGRDVSISEAIHILKLKGGEGSLHDAVDTGEGRYGGGRGSRRPEPMMTEQEVGELRLKIIEKLERTLELDIQDKLEEGFTKVGDDWIPPGWVREDGTSREEAARIADEAEQARKAEQATMYP